MTVLGDMSGLPPDVAAALDEQVEVAPGIKKRLGDCTHSDVAGMFEASVEGTMNHREISDLLTRCLTESGSVPAELRQRIDAANTGPEVIAVRNELRTLIAEAGA
ncbi:MAG: hypothetical protein QOI89_2487 [Solirubrobacteraceae bacterium]|jgi:hypothetical protein|nr:hypothetical protein [Solirubrobacteraceae bacterium]